MKTKKTKVLFLIEKIGEGVFAYFPEMVHSFNGYRPDNMTCYSHIGQHSACHPDYAKECKEATPEQYAELKKELEGIGYILDVQNPPLYSPYGINGEWFVYDNYAHHLIMNSPKGKRKDIKAICEKMNSEIHHTAKNFKP